MKSRDTLNCWTVFTLIITYISFHKNSVSSVFSVQVKMQKSLLCAWLRQKLCHCQHEKSSDLSSNSSSFERTQSVRKVRKRLKRKYSQPISSDTSSDTNRIHAYSVPNVSEIDSVCYDNVWISSGSLIVSLLLVYLSRHWGAKNWNFLKDGNLGIFFCLIYQKHGTGERKIGLNGICTGKKYANF